MFRFTSLGSDRAALTEVSNIFVNLFTVSFVFSLNTHRLTQRHSHTDRQRQSDIQSDRQSDTRTDRHIACCRTCFACIIFVNLQQLTYLLLPVYCRDVTDSASESGGIRHFFQKSEIRRILAIRSRRIQNC